MNDEEMKSMQAYAAAAFGQPEASEPDVIEAEWRDIPGYEGVYQINSVGIVRKSDGSRIYKPVNNGSGYAEITLRSAGKAKRHLIHRLVMLAFVGVCPEKMEVNHINGIRNDNRIGNLEYVTRQQNVIHARDNLNPNYAVGTRVGCSKLNEEKVREIRRLCKSGATMKSVAIAYSVSHRQVFDIVHYKYWRHVSDE